MSDADLRELERRFRETGSVEDEAAWLRARVQAGELEQGKLELAAYCGHEGARSLFAAREDDLPPTKARELRRWIRGLSRAGRTPQVRAALAVVTPEVRTGSPEVRHLLASAAQWCLTPSQARADQAEAAATCLPPNEDDPGYQEGDDGRFLEARSVANLAAAAQRHDKDDQAFDYWLKLAFHNVAEGPLWIAEAKSTIQAELVPWALGYGDPVRDRVEARQREAQGE